MFTGIVQGCAELLSAGGPNNLRRYTFRYPDGALQGIRIGDSIAHNGCCLTVVGHQGDTASFDLIDETLHRTNLAGVQPGQLVNYERAARIGDEIGGHLVSGHIVATAEVMAVVHRADNCEIRLRLAAPHHRFLFTKGFIAVDGISLTIGEVEGEQFSLHLIPETLRRTNLGSRVVGDRLNIEIDPLTQAIVERVEQVLIERERAP